MSSHAPPTTGQPFAVLKLSVGLELEGGNVGSAQKHYSAVVITIEDKQYLVTAGHVAMHFIDDETLDSHLRSLDPSAPWVEWTLRGLNVLAPQCHDSNVTPCPVDRQTIQVLGDADLGICELTQPYRGCAVAVDQIRDTTNAPIIDQESIIAWGVDDSDAGTTSSRSGTAYATADGVGPRQFVTMGDPTNSAVNLCFEDHVQRDRRDLIIPGYSGAPIYDDSNRLVGIGTTARAERAHLGISERADQIIDLLYKSNAKWRL